MAWAEKQVTAYPTESGHQDDNFIDDQLVMRDPMDLSRNTADYAFPFNKNAKQPWLSAAKAGIRLACIERDIVSQVDLRKIEFRCQGASYRILPSRYAGRATVPGIWRPRSNSSGLKTQISPPKGRCRRVAPIIPLSKEQERG